MLEQRTLSPDLPESGGVTSSIARGFSLPPDLLEQARDRLRLISGLGVVLYAIAAAIGGWRLASVDRTLVYVVPNLVGMSMMGAVWIATGMRRLPHTLVLNLGLALQVGLCLLVELSYTEYVYRVTGGDHTPDVTWATIFIVIFPTIIPSPPRRTLLISIVAALMTPVAYGILEVLSLADLEPAIYLLGMISPAFGVVIAYYASRVLHGLRQEMVEARELGNYRLEELLGRGGMGEVWKARHQLLARPAAIKVVSRKLLADLGGDAGSDAIRRFEREARVTATLTSPHTVELYDFGRTEDGAVFYVMELLEGLDLEKLVKEHGPLPAARVIHILIAACDSLAEAHGHGLVHRDIKPANLFLCRRGVQLDVVKILDFGLVSLQKPVGGADPQQSQAGNIVGTPAFLSPEVAKGRKDVDGRSDLYALGCVAYWLLTGQPVFDHKNAISMILAHADKEPQPPSERGVDVPADLEQVVMDCLAKKPDDRPASADVLARRLAPLADTHPWTQLQAEAWWDLNTGGEEMGIEEPGVREAGAGS